MAISYPTHSGSVRLNMRIRLPPLEPDQKSLLEQDGDTSERIVARLLCVNANHHFQVSSGPGSTWTGKSGM